MATRFSARIAAAEARLRTGNAKATRSSDRIAKMNKLSERDELQQATAGGRVQKPGGRQSRIKKSSATRASRAERGNEQRFRDTNDPASPTAVLNGPGSHRPAYYGGPQIEFWNGNLPPDAEDLDDSGVHDQPENDAPDDVDPDPDPHTEANRIGPFLQILFNGVTTQRALRRKCNELRKCCQDVRDADFRITQYRQVAAFRNPATDEDWNMHNALLLRITEWEAKLSERQGLEKQINSQIKYLESRAEKWTYHEQDFQQLTQERRRPQFWSDHNDFWEAFDRYQATSRSLSDICHELEQSKEDTDAFDLVIDHKLTRDLDFEANDAGSYSVVGDEFAYQDMSRVPVLVQKHEELQQREHTTRKLQTEQWMHLLGLAENVFIKDEILELAKENGKEEEPEPSNPEPEDLEREDPQKSHSEIRKDSSRERLRLALEACRKARNDFDDARKFSQEEIEQSPQPVTEDILGLAKALKLARLTHALHTAEEEYSDARRAAREAGIAKPQEQTADFSDQSDDGYDTAVIEKAVVQASERVSRVQGWTGLHLEPQEMTEEVQTDFPQTIQDLQSIRLGEDSFDLTEARGRTRDRIDAMAMESETLRDAGDFPKADADPLGFDLGEP